MRYMVHCAFLVLAYVAIAVVSAESVGAQPNYCTAVSSRCVSRDTHCSDSLVPGCSTLCQQQCNGGTQIGGGEIECGAGGPISGCSGTDIKIERRCTCTRPPTCEEQCQSEACLCGCFGGTWDQTQCLYSPIVVDIGRSNGPSHEDGFNLTSAIEGVAFPMGLRPDRMIKTAWTDQRSPIAFLALDRNNDGLITTGTELFGGVTPKLDGTRAENGFHALADLDSNQDGKVSGEDAMFLKLLLWVDANHDGVSNRRELLTLSQAGVTALATAYSESDERDVNGNWYRYQSTAIVRGEQRRTVDVYFVSTR